VISVGSVSDVPLLRDAFLSMHEHHRRRSAVTLTEPDERAWSERVSTYEQHFAAGRALLHVARIDGSCVGYAFTVLHPGSDDTFPLGAGYAELYTLAVVPGSRGSGIGSALLDAMDATLRARAIPNLMVAVMGANEAAIRLYRRRGLIPGELILYRIGGEPSDLTTNRLNPPSR
jgi:ribosomal protein S18 acetylase RimI-like enzyme